MNNRGMTLLEVMFTVAMLTAVMGVLFGLAISFGDTARVQDVKVTSHDEVRRAMDFIVKDLRQAASGLINWADLPGESVSYRVPMDLSGNGIPVNESGNLELSPERTIMRDLEDLTGDGLTVRQLIVTDGDTTRVLANEISPDAEQPGPDGVFGPAQDLNGNGRLDQGVWFEPWGQGGIRITLQASGQSRQGHILRTDLREVVYPRN